MIRTAILGASSPLAGEIIRIFTHHPETELVYLVEPSLKGKNVSTVHHGLVGEIPLVFTDKINPEDIDIIIFSENSPLPEEINGFLNKNDNLKIISLFKANDLNRSSDLEIGLSEINRKNLVRGARMAFILPTEIVLPLIALIPLANFLLLNSDLSIEVNIPEDLVKNTENILVSILGKEIRKRQVSFNNTISISIVGEKDNKRINKTVIKFDSKIPIEEVKRIYNETYDDHNFTFLSDLKTNGKEVEGTQKVIINLFKPTPEELEIEVYSDARMRGGAGDAVHVYNLFCGLHEKTGLTFKSSAF